MVAGQREGAGLADVVPVFCLAQARHRWLMSRAISGAK